MRKFDSRFAFLMSLLAHALLAVVLSLPIFTHTPPETSTVTVELLPPPIENARPPKDDVVAKQIVDQADHSLNDEKPLKDAFLSKNDQSVKKQTVARERGEFRNASAKHSVDANPNAGALKPVIEKAVKTKPTMQDLLGTSPTAMLQHKEKRDQQQGDGTNAPKGAQASRTDDYLKKVEAGDETMLNTREFKYFTYYSRIRRQLSQYWEPGVRNKLTRLFKQGRTIASNQDHITKLLIVLNPQGRLVKVQVLSESGVTDLDDAATEAFRSAAPFPNPPKGIVEDDGTVKIRWDFVLES